MEPLRRNGPNAVRRRRLGVGSAALAASVVTLNWTWGRLPAKPPTPPGSQFLELPDGPTIRYRQRPGHGTPVLAVHGQPGTAEDFTPLLGSLTDRPVITVDRPGYGWSSGGYAPIVTQLEAIHALLAHLAIPQVVIVGHSYGGTLALAYAQEHPDTVTGLVLVAAAGGGIRTSPAEALQAHAIRLLGRPGVATIADATFSQLVRTIAFRAMATSAATPAVVDPERIATMLALHMTLPSLDAYAGEALALDALVDRIDRRLDTLHVPTVVIQGRSDQIVPERFGVRLTDGIPGARLELVSGGHQQLDEHPELIAQAISSLDAS